MREKERELKRRGKIGSWEKIKNMGLEENRIRGEVEGMRKARKRDIDQEC